MRTLVVSCGLLVIANVAACAGDRDLATEQRGAESASVDAPASEADRPSGGCLVCAAHEEVNATDAGDATTGFHSQFACKEQGAAAYRPYYLQAIDGGYKDYSTTPKGLLGQNPMTTRQECDRARTAANDTFGVICSRTGLDGWKPTLYTGTVPGRADFGYLGGSSITSFADCLKATESSSRAGVCFWGGSDWYVAPIDREGVTAGPFPTIDICVMHTRIP